MSVTPGKPTVFLVTTVAEQLRHHYGMHIDLLVASGVELHVFASGADTHHLERSVMAHGLPIGRGLGVRGFVRSTWSVARAGRRLRPDLVIYGSPAASLSAAMATVLTSPRRVFIVHGLREETLKGPKRWLIHALTILTALLSTRVVFASPSLKVSAGEFMKSLSRSTVAPGGAVGVEVPREAKLKAREPRVVGYVGRLAKDKGLEELVDAFCMLLRTHPDLELLIIGAPDQSDPLSPLTSAIMASHPAITVTGFAQDVRPFYDQMDIFCLPSKREGLPTAILEAMAARVPVVAADATGTRDIVDSSTGRLCSVGDADSLARALRLALEGPEESATRAANAYDLVSHTYDRVIVANWWHDFYSKELAGR
ncbi:glycosyltransferase involved in cell wall biosynthesis [Phycicoccus badiiscoriae]|uniref:D-inositol 3-phosphate glycosyltransferase n=1 Tax=Pedococcus badiiscoriae TaxID=642776 RepID=A0A852WHE3_9MICO|nr:glycosyltransferase [Pedococcus badiiscoriae]NYG06074.1 glycosyltransferase involved in cell wall biosynthesis [Pedococcus badiiscoriae]